jgi:hypothetical protein
MTTTTTRIAGSLLALALLVAATLGWGCDKNRRTYVETYGTVGVAVPPPLLPPPAAPQYQQGYEQPAQPLAQQPADQAGVEVLTRGPVHEAFAEPVVADPAAGLVINRAPPEAVQEMPPADRPAGAIWIPGYWAWDDDRGDFIWVSGIWRIAPPAGRWVPGYWAFTSGGYQWTPGFWLGQAVQQVEYLPTPPASLEMGPVGVAPSPDYIWSTGYWYRDSLRYAWRPGCWQAARADWVWVPAHYIWTPRGCVFAAGYWDYDIGRRGLLFAPVYFGRPLYARPGYCYTPTVVIETNYLSIALFSRPRYSHYYFGDYFAASYVSLGILPWYECRSRRDWYDPIYFHAAWSHRSEDRWEDRQREHYDLLRRDVAARPPRTFALQAGVQRPLVQASGRPAPRPAMMAAPLSEVVARKAPGMKFERLDAGRRTDLQKYATSLSTYRDQRVAVETGRPKATAPALARPTAAQKPDWTRPTNEARTADRAAPRSLDAQTARPVARAPAEVRKPATFAPPVVQPAARQPESRVATRPTAPSTWSNRPQPAVQPARQVPPTAPAPTVTASPPLVQPAPSASRPSPIPQEIKRSQPQVAAPEVLRSQTLVRPQAESRQPTTPVQPQRIERQAPPQAAPAPRPQVAPSPPPQAQPQRIERPASTVAPQRSAPAPRPQVAPSPPPQVAPSPPPQAQPQRVERPAPTVAPQRSAPAPRAPVAAPVERPRPPAAEAPRAAPQAAPRTQESAPRFVPPTTEGKEKDKDNERKM